jgi:photosystem II stability/assembly factor-like uncharacterized protein
VFFINNSDGLAVGGDKSVYKSADGGATWQKKYTSLANLVNIGMSSNTHAIVIGYNGRVLVTRNGGTSFDSLTLADPPLFDVFCLNSNVAFAIGQFFWKTNDGGSTWVRGTDFGAAGKAIMFLDAMTGWAAGDFGLKKTTDGGSTWQTVNISTIPGTTVFILQFSDLNKGFLATNLSAWKTINGGTTWIDLHDMENSFHDLQFINDNIGYLTDGRYLLKTTDGGSTWQIVLRLGQGVFFELHFTDINHGWAGSSTGAIFRYL